jgi:hypothetical protein
MEHSWNDPEGKTEVFQEKSTPVLLRPPQIPHRLVGLDSRSAMWICGGLSYTGKVLCPNKQVFPCQVSYR